VQLRSSDRNRRHTNAMLQTIEIHLRKQTAARIGNKPLAQPHTAPADIVAKAKRVKHTHRVGAKRKPGPNRTPGFGAFGSGKGFMGMLQKGGKGKPADAATGDKH
jgi:hypothetical protein